MSYGEYAGDAELIRAWAEHGIPTNSSTLDHAVRLLVRQRAALVEAFDIIGELTGGCKCSAAVQAKQQGVLDHGDAAVA